MVPCASHRCATAADGRRCARHRTPRRAPVNRPRGGDGRSAQPCRCAAARRPHPASPQCRVVTATALCSCLVCGRADPAAALRATDERHRRPQTRYRYETEQCVACSPIFEATAEIRLRGQPLVAVLGSGWRPLSRSRLRRTRATSRAPRARRSGCGTARRRRPGTGSRGPRPTQGAGAALSCLAGDGPEPR